VGPPPICLPCAAPRQADGPAGGATRRVPAPPRARRACKRPAGREALRPASEPSPASAVVRVRQEAYRALSRGRRRRPVPVRHPISLPASCSTPHPPPRDPCASLSTAAPPPPCQTEPSPATGGHSERQGRSTPPAADGVVPGPATASNPLKRSVAARAAPLRPCPAANSTAGEVQTRRGLHCKREGIFREIYASFQGPGCKGRFRVTAATSENH
jgi:hypothetical protein